MRRICPIASRIAECVDEWIAKLAAGHAGDVIPVLEGERASQVEAAIELLAEPHLQELDAQFGCGRAHLHLAIVVTDAILREETLELFSDHLDLVGRTTQRSAPADLFVFLFAAVWHVCKHDRLPVQRLVNTLLVELFDRLKDLARILSMHLSKNKELAGTPAPVFAYDSTPSNITIRKVMGRLMLSSRGYDRDALIAAAGPVKPNNRPKKRRDPKRQSYVHVRSRADLHVATCVCNAKFEAQQRIELGSMSPTDSDTVVYVFDFHLAKAVQSILLRPDCRSHPKVHWFKAPFLSDMRWYALHLEEPSRWEVPAVIGGLVLELALSDIVWGARFDYRHRPVGSRTLVSTMISDTTLYAVLVKAGICPRSSPVEPSAAAKALRIYVGAAFWSGSRTLSALCILAQAVAWTGGGGGQGGPRDRQ
ncbi:hypothetical protein C8F01DRAFT_1154611 [Mycena amicta]|nr:hypothetical protein C8F01DRAFT_1154611 [Mycena amicta]